VRRLHSLPPNPHVAPFGQRCTVTAVCARAWGTLTLPVKKTKSNGSLRSSVTSSLLPVTAVTARGSKYFGRRSSKALLVAGKPSESLRMHGLPAAITWTAGSASHLRARGHGHTVTIAEHRPRSHQAHLEWTPSRMVHWAQSIGPHTARLFERILANKPHPRSRNRQDR
jgi:hypothetical protein